MSCLSDLILRSKNNNQFHQDIYKGQMDRRKIVTNFTGVVTTLFFIFGMSAQAQTMGSSNKVTISYEVRKISGLNTNVSEFCPVIFGNKLIYTSNREYNLNNWGEDELEQKWVHQHLCSRDHEYVIGFCRFGSV